MNPNFESSGIYPFSTEPAGGWGHPNPTHECVISYIPIPGKAAKIDEHNPKICTLVDIEFATRFPDFIAAERAAALLTAK